MVSDLSMLDSATTTKQNLVGRDDEETIKSAVFKEKIRLWMKRDRMKVDGVERNVIIPFNTFIEPFYSADDVDADVTTGLYDSANERYRLYSELNGNYKIITSKTIHLMQNKSVKSILVYVDAKDTVGNDATSNIQIEIYNGSEWIAAKNGGELFFDNFNGADLDADLNADLTGNFMNQATGITSFTDTFDNTTYKNPDKTTATWTGTGEIVF